MRGGLALSLPHRVSVFPACCGHLASARDRGRGLAGHGSTVVGQPACGAARHDRSAWTSFPRRSFCARMVRAVANGLHRAGQLIHKHTRIGASRWLCAASDVAEPDGSNASARASPGRPAAHRRHRACTFAPVRAGKARSAPPTNRTSHSIGMLLGRLCLRARARGRVAHGSWSWLGSARFFWMCTCTMLALSWFPAHSLFRGLETDKRTNIYLLSKRLR